MGVRASELDSWRLIEGVVGMRGAHHPLTVKGRLPDTIGFASLYSQGELAVPFISATTAPPMHPRTSEARRSRRLGFPQRKSQRFSQVG